MRLLHKILPVLLMLSLSAAAPAALTASSVQAAEIRASVCGTFTNAFAAVKKAFELHGSDIAAVILEPFPANAGL